MSSTPAAKQAKARAEASFKRHEPEPTHAPGPQAVEAERAAVAAKTARLRDLRLAKEASNRIAAEVRRERRQP